jgi:hypothetical protein
VLLSVTVCSDRWSVFEIFESFDVVPPTKLIEGRAAGAGRLGVARWPGRPGPCPHTRARTEHSEHTELGGPTDWGCRADDATNMKMP